MKKSTCLFSLFTLLALSSVVFAEVPTGNVEGKARLHGRRPKMTAPAIVEYQGPCGNKRPTSVIEMKRDNILNITAWLTPKDSYEYKNPEKRAKETYVITAENCDFHPTISPIAPGTKVSIVNKDPDAQWLLVEREGRKRKQVMLVPGEAPYQFEMNDKTDIHLKNGFYPWMEAWIRPMKDVLFITHSDWQGIFTFKDIPAGDYVLHTWHPSLGDHTEDITVRKNKRIRIEVSYTIPEKQPLPIIRSSMLKEMFGVGGDGYDSDPFKK